MKLVHKINTIALVITAVLYALIITIYLAMMAQIVLGIIQVMLAVTVTRLYYGELPHRFRNLLHTYWILAVVDGVVVGWLQNADYDAFSNVITVVAYFILPMIIAAYFVYVTFQIKRHLNIEP